MDQKQSHTQFDLLCDGVLNNFSIVHENLEKLLDVKDTLLTQALPPNVHASLTISTTRMYRSISDMHMTLNELVRLVRLFSTSWEEKSVLPRQIYDDYETKKAQLAVAVKRLEMLDAYANKVHREKLVSNWGQVFTKLTTKNSHGRRWKFHISKFKKQASKGAEHLRDYLQEMGESSDDESDERQEEFSEIPQAQIPSNINQTHEDKTTSLKPASPETTDFVMEITPVELILENQSHDRIGEEEDSVADVDIEEQKRSIQVTISTEDKGSWTHEPEYYRFLHVRVCAPEIESRQTRCVVNCGEDIYKTKILDKKGTEEENASTENKKMSSKKASKQRLIGSKVRRVTLQDVAEDVTTTNKTRTKYRFEECTFAYPEPGVCADEDDSGANPLSITVCSGTKQEMVAMASVTADDLEKLDLPVIYSRRTTDSSVHFESRIEQEGGDEELEAMEPLRFPLYPTHVIRSTERQDPIGKIPLVLFWEKKLKPRIVSRSSETSTIEEIIREETGLDIAKIKRGDLAHRRYGDSLLGFRLASERETAPDELMPRTEEDIELDQVGQDDPQQLQQQYQQRPERVADNLVERHNTATRNSGLKNSRSGNALPAWRDPVPDDFLQRLRYFEEESERKRMELKETVDYETKELHRRRLTDQCRFSDKYNDALTNPLQDITLPAVFMPTKSTRMLIFNPRASKYFHPTGSAGSRLTQPPSMLDLPPLPQSKVSIVNLFDMRQSVRQSKGEWLMQQYLGQQGAAANSVPHAATPTHSHNSPRNPVELMDNRVQVTSGNVAENLEDSEKTSMFTETQKPLS